MKALFVGNSYTAFHDMPRVLAEMARASGRTLDVDMSVCGGKNLEWHWEEGDARSRIAAGGRAVVVLQDHSLGPIEARDRMSEYARRFDAEIRKSGARTVFYMTWARRHKPEMQDELSAAYRAAARELGAQVAPVGEAWRLAFSRNPSLVLHEDDGSHPNPKGAYLTACVFFSALFGASPAGLPRVVQVEGRAVVQVAEAEARFLQEVAWDAACAEGGI